MGSVTVTRPSQTSVTKGVLRWSRFPHAGRTEEEHVFGLADEPAGGQVEDLLAGDGRIERPVELVESLQFAEGGRLHAASDLPFFADEQLVLQDQFQELGMAQLMPEGFLEPDIEGLGQAREPQLAKRGLQSVIPWKSLLLRGWEGE